jgi:hypothetical protein
MPSFVRSGAAFTANSQTASSQTRSSITALNDGGYVVVWQTLASAADGSGAAIKAQRYNAQGVAVGAETLVNNAGAGDQTWPKVASLASGGYAVTWETADSTQDGSGSAIKARLFDAAGAPVGGEFRVNSQTVMDQKEPTLVGLADGGFVVAWYTTDTAQDGAGWAIKAQRYDASGAAVGAEFRVNTTAFGSQYTIDIASLSSGGFVVTWQTGNSAGTQVSAQVYGADGVKAGGEIIVSNGFSSHTGGRVTGLANGGFVVAWMTDNGDGIGIRAQMFGAAGNKVGADFIVNPGTSGFNPDIAALADGTFLITWEGRNGGIKGQTYSATGQRLGSEYTIADPLDSTEAAPSVAALADGSFIVGWTQALNGTTGAEDIRLQRLRANTAPELGADTRAFSIAENSQIVAQITATDSDGPGTLSYSIVGGADAARFTISGGQLRFVASPNFEAPTDANGDNVYQVIVRASDGELTDVQTISVTVTNVNEGVTITSNGAGATAAIAVVENGLLATTVTAVDVDGGPVTYSIAGGADASRFLIDSSTGALSFLMIPDFEQPGDQDGNNVYEVTVRASDGQFADTQALSITVGNANERPMIVSNGGGTSASVGIDEGQTVVTTVVASDPDGPGPITYSITGGLHADLFTINAATGALSFIDAPDYEAGGNFYTVQVTASDGELSSWQSVQVSVRNVNEGVTITSASAASVEENGTAAGVVTAVDADGDAVAFTISGGADAGLFAIDAATGALSFLAAPNFEAAADADGDNVYQVVVSASDGALSDSRTLSVTVTDRSEAIAFVSGGGGDEAAIAVAENQGNVLGLLAVDPDGATPTYSIAGGADAALFRVDPVTHALQFKDLPDFEAPRDADGNNVYEVVVATTDGQTVDYQTVSVTVGNVYEGVSFAAQRGFVVNENSALIGAVAATGETGASIVYAITGGADASLFNVDPLTGALSWVLGPDFETPRDSGGDNVYDLVVTAGDGTSSASQSVSVRVGNVDEALEIFSYSGADTVALTLPENGWQVGNVEAWDPDFEPILFAITGGADAALFAIDPDNGELTFVYEQRPDFEAPADADGDNVYDVVVTASSPSSSDTQAFAVTVGNVNEGVFITSNGGGTSATIAVNEDDRYVTTVVGSDPDGAVPTYAIMGGADASRFTIDASTGVLSFIVGPDYEMPGDQDYDDVYDVVVGASDGYYTTSQSLHIAVGNVEEAVEFVSYSGADIVYLIVPENGSSAAQVEALDHDGGAITYSITGGADAGLFTVDAATGALRFTSSPNFEAPADADGDNVYQVIVTARSDFSSDWQGFGLIVGNVNEPVAITSNGGSAAAAVAVAENATAVTIVAASDPDGNAVTYSIAGGADAAKFTIDAVTGVLAFVSAPNFEAPGDAGGNNVYDVVVAASDGSLTDTQAIAVSVGNVSEAVVITSNGAGNSAGIAFAENGTAVTLVVGNDPDGGPVTYAIVGGADASRFTINATTGALVFVAAPNFEAPADAGANNAYDVIVSASDGSSTDTQAIAVIVTNVNEAPAITSNGGGGNATVAAWENNTAIALVAASDPEGAPLTYAIVGGADASRFTIDATTGILSFVAAPNFEAPADVGANNVYDVVVSASDGSFTDTQALAVSVGNLNEAPVITSNGGGSSASIAVSENGRDVTIVAAADPDGSSPVYSIVGGADASRFTINAQTGLLQFVTAPNYELPADANGDNVYSVIVQAGDGQYADTQNLNVTVGNLRDGNIVNGTSAGDSISGTSTNPALRTSAAEDDVSGKDGHDSIDGLAGDDYLAGDAGNDVLIGGAGADRLTGGLGKDDFTYNLVSESTPGARDVITDFSRAQADKISLSGIDANTLLTGNQAFTFIGAAAFSNVAGQLRYSTSGGVTLVSGDVNGDGVADFQIELTGTLAPVASDFVL